MKNFLPWLAPTVALSLPLGGLAQPSSDAQTATPSPQLSYQSAFSDYKPWTDIKAGDWRRLNDDVGKAPGGSGHVSGAAPASHAPGQMPGHAMPMNPGHQGHPMPGAKP